MRVLINKPNVYSTHGAPLAVGSVHVVQDDYGRSLVQSQLASEVIQTPISSKHETKGDYLFTSNNRNIVSNGGSVHQVLKRLPGIGGKTVLASLIWENPQNNPAFNVLGYSLAAARSPFEDQPKDAAGNPVVWQVGGALTVAAGAAGLNSIVETISNSHVLQIIPDALDPIYGTIVHRTANETTGMGRGMNGSNVQLNLLNDPMYTERVVYAAAGTALNTDTFTTTSPADPASNLRNFTPCQLRLQLLERVYNICHSGDSRDQGEGSISNANGWQVRAVNKLNKMGFVVGHEFHGIAGSSHTTFFNMAMDRIAKTRAVPDIFTMQGGSTNGSTWTDDNVSTMMNENMAFVAACRAKGIKPRFVTMYRSLSATTPDGIANLAKLNAALLSSGVPCIDLGSVPEFNNGSASFGLPFIYNGRQVSLDGAHLTDQYQEYVANNIAVPAYRQILTDIATGVA